MSRIRGFEIVSSYEGKGINLPKRATAHAAGYDFEAAEDTVVPSIWKALFKNRTHKAKEETASFSLPEENQRFLKSTLVPTGIKAYMKDDEYLQLANRSSNPIKNQLTMPNGVGIIDADYYGNEDNEGHIYFQFVNYGIRDHVIKKGERIGQGIFMSFLKVDHEAEGSAKRTGGFGSSGR